MIEKPVSQAVIDWSCDVSMQASLPATLGCAKAFSSTDLRGDLKSFTVPTLIIHGTADQTVPIDASARAAAKGIPGSKLIEYDGAPHGLLESHKTRVIEDVLAFLK
jgi:pimeloyl-ACP methyl ester carboxylesterase